MKKKNEIITYIVCGIIMAGIVIGLFIYLSSSVSQFAHDLQANTTNTTVSMEPLCAFKGTSNTFLKTYEVCYIICKRSEQNDYYLLTFPANSSHDYTQDWMVASGSKSFELDVKKTPYKVDIKYQGVPVSLKSITKEEAEAYITSSNNT